jgi:two-component system, NarL family, nitrate/nitrite response regulator NarL
MSLESAARLSALTSRAREVAVSVCEGRPNKDIAHELNLAEGTVKTHLHRIFQKLHVRNRMALTIALSDRAKTT